VNETTHHTELAARAIGGAGKTSCGCSPRAGDDIARSNSARERAPMACASRAEQADRRS